MPFTLSHVAAVAPFARLLTRWRMLSATVIGSMVPDFGLLMPWRPARSATHGMAALVTFCLPVGLLSFWIFQRLIKAAFMESLPNAVVQRWRPWGAPASPKDPAQWLLAACGVLIGAVTHLVWDGFTHEGARGMRLVPALDDPTVDIAGHVVAGAHLLQDFSSLIGLGVVMMLVAYGLRPGGDTAMPPPRLLTAPERSAWMLAYGLSTLIFAALSFIDRRSLYGHSPRLGAWVANGAVASLRGLAAAAVLVSLMLQLRLRRMRPPSPGGTPQ